MVYPNIENELANVGKKKRDLAEIWNVRKATVYDKLNGKSPIMVEEILILRDSLFPHLTIDYLLEKSGECYATNKVRSGR